MLWTIKNNYWKKFKNYGKHLLEVVTEIPYQT